MAVTVEDRMLIAAYHVATFPGWKEIVDEQLAALCSSGLDQSLDKLLVSVVGDFHKVDNYIKSIVPKAIVAHTGDYSQFEFPTLRLLQGCSLEYGDAAMCYFHTKAASNGAAGAHRHRRTMQSVVIERWRECVGALDRHFDTAGTLWQDDPWPHYSGNFWWARGHYLSSLPAPNDSTNRYEAEMWLGRSLIRKQYNIESDDPWSKPSAWVGLEVLYRGHLSGLKPQRIVEVGVDYGYSAFTFARDFPYAQVFAVDPYGCYALHDDAEAWLTRKSGTFTNLRHLKMASCEAARQFADGSVDLLHLDADHSISAVRDDLITWWPKLRDGGYAMLHDTRSCADSVGLVFCAVEADKTEISEHHGLGFIRKAGSKLTLRL